MVKRRRGFFNVIEEKERGRKQTDARQGKKGRFYAGEGRISGKRIRKTKK